MDKKRRRAGTVEHCDYLKVETWKDSIWELFNNFKFVLLNIELLKTILLLSIGIY